jgi:hypothetical protein
VLPLLEGRQHGWPAWTWLSLAAAPVLLACFVAHQRRLTRSGGSPLLDVSLFRERSFSAGLATQLCFWAGQGSFFVVLALYLQSGRGLKPLAAGLLVGAGMGLVLAPLASTVLQSLACWSELRRSPSCCRAGPSAPVVCGVAPAV